MLTTILPGLRDLRTPLATGYLWLVALFLIFAELVPKPDSDIAIVRQVFDLSTALGTTTLLAVASFIAYLIGAAVSIEEVSVSKLVPRLRRFHLIRKKHELTRIKDIQQQPYTTTYSLSHYEQLLNDTVDRVIDVGKLYTDMVSDNSQDALYFRGFTIGKGSMGNKTLEFRDTLSQLNSHIEKEQPIIANKLHSENSPLWDDYDREIAEGNFRISVAAPLTAVLLAIFTRFWLYVGWDWRLLPAAAATGTVLGLIYLVAVRGIKRLNSATEIIRTAVVMDTALSPFLTLTKSTISEMETKLSRVSNYSPK